MARKVAAPLSIGIVGGMSPQSTFPYYQLIIQRHLQQRRDHAYPRIVIASVSFGPYIKWQHDGDWAAIGRNLAREFRAVAAAGADFAVLATNTMHKVLPAIRSPIPVLSILDVVGEHCRGLGIRTVGLTGTKFTMTDGFYQKGLEDQGLRVLIPPPNDITALHSIIYDELVAGVVKPGSQQKFVHLAERLVNRGAGAVLLACTELEMLRGPATAHLALVDTTQLHAYAAWEVAVGLKSLRRARAPRSRRAVRR